VRAPKYGVSLFRGVDGVRRANGGAGAAFDAFVWIDDIDGIPLGDGIYRTNWQTCAGAGATVSDKIRHETHSLDINLPYTFDPSCWFSCENFDIREQSLEI
jgi:hypothetical protein